MKFERWRIAGGIVLILLSIAFYCLHYLIFRDPHHLFIFLVGDIAFVFIEVLMVTMIIHELLTYRDKKAKLYKLNMIIGAFYSEVGRKLLKIISEFDHHADQYCETFASCTEWLNNHFERKQKEDITQKYSFDAQRGNLQHLKEFLLSKRNFMLNLLQNATLFEHDAFSDLLWAVFHLTEELEQRKNVNDLTPEDYAHIGNDIKRAFSLLTTQWLTYMKHLQSDYPYLFSLAVRTNPFDPHATAEIKK